MAEGFLQYVHESRCKFRFEADRTSTDEIESGIRFLINDIVKRIEKTAPEFKILDIIPTGSSYEGTKNEAPNEFDFMLILKELSGPGKLNLHQGCSDWYPQIELKKDVRFPRKYMVNVNYTNRHNQYEQFLGSPRIVVQNFWKRIQQLIQETTFGVDTPRGKLSVKHCEGRKLVFAYIHDLENALKKTNYDPEAEKAIVFKGHVDIGVDLMLAVEHPHIADILSRRGFPSTFEDLLSKSKCHIVAKACHTEHGANGKCWFISFSAMERDLVYDMDPHHKQCYKILKSLFVCEISASRKIMNLSSYVLKTAFLFHVHGDNRCKKSNLSVCIKEVLEYLSSNLFHVRMPCFFARDMNTWGHLLETPRFRWTPSGNLKGMPHPFELCWIKLMFEFINYLKSAVYENRMAGTLKTKDDYEKLISKCNYFKAAASRLIKLYSDRFQYEVYRLEEGHRTLSACNDGFFYDYLEHLKKCFGFELHFLKQ